MKLLNNKWKAIGLVAAFVTVSGYGVAQKTNVVSAALEFKKFEQAVGMQKVDEAKASIVDAKKYIDPAMLDESTKNDEKAHFYNAVINFGMVQMSGLDDSGEFDVYDSDSIKDVIKHSVEIASKKNRWKGEVEDYFNSKTSQMIMVGQMMFKKKNYQMAFAGFAGAYAVKDIVGIEKEKDDMRTNAIISARNYIDTLVKQGEEDKAMDFIAESMEIFTDSEELAIEGVNIALSQDNLEKAEEFFNLAAKNSPDNKALFSNMGSIYLTTADKAFREFSEMTITDEGYQEKSDEVESLYSKAEKNLQRALEIDPDYAEAAYNLGVLYLGRGEKLKTTAAQMDLYDPDYEKVSARSKDMYEKAIAPLEVYLSHDPNNSGVLRVLFQVHRNAGNTEKALEYKRKADEIDAEAEEGE